MRFAVSSIRNLGRVSPASLQLFVYTKRRDKLWGMERCYCRGKYDCRQPRRAKAQQATSKPATNSFRRKVTSKPRKPSVSPSLIAGSRTLPRYARGIQTEREKPEGSRCAPVSFYQKTSWRVTYLLSPSSRSSPAQPQFCLLAERKTNGRTRKRLGNSRLSPPALPLRETLHRLPENIYKRNFN